MDYMASGAEQSRKCMQDDVVPALAAGSAPYHCKCGAQLAAQAPGSQLDSASAEASEAGDEQQAQHQVQHDLQHQQQLLDLHKQLEAAEAQAADSEAKLMAAQAKVQNFADGGLVPGFEVEELRRQLADERSRNQLLEKDQQELQGLRKQVAQLQEQLDTAGAAWIDAKKGQLTARTEGEQLEQQLADLQGANEAQNRLHMGPLEEAQVAVGWLHGQAWELELQQQELEVAAAAGEQRVGEAEEKLTAAVEKLEQQEKWLRELEESEQMLKGQLQPMIDMGGFHIQAKPATPAAGGQFAVQLGAQVAPPSRAATTALSVATVTGAAAAVSPSQVAAAGGRPLSLNPGLAAPATARGDPVFPHQQLLPLPSCGNAVMEAYPSLGMPSGLWLSSLGLSWPIAGLITSEGAAAGVRADAAPGLGAAAGALVPADCAVPKQPLVPIITNVFTSMHPALCDSLDFVPPGATSTAAAADWVGTACQGLEMVFGMPPAMSPSVQGHGTLLFGMPISTLQVRGSVVHIFPCASQTTGSLKRGRTFHLKAHKHADILL